MITGLTGAHVVISSTDPDADRAFFRDVLGLPAVDAGDGWLIFALPPAEAAVHPAAVNGRHELYLMCADVGAMMAALERHGVRCSDVQTQPWGVLTSVTLPGGGAIGLYQPRHETAI